MAESLSKKIERLEREIEALREEIGLLQQKVEDRSFPLAPYMGDPFRVNPYPMPATTTTVTPLPSGVTYVFLE